MYGHNVSHAKNRTRRIFKPNLHNVKMNVGGTRKTMRLCTKCLRIWKNASKTQEKAIETKAEEAPVSVSA